MDVSTVSPDSSLSVPGTGARRLELTAAGALGVTAVVTWFGVAGDLPILTQWFGSLPAITPIGSVVMMALALGHLSRPGFRVAAIVAAGLGAMLLIAGLVARQSGWERPPTDWLRSHIAITGAGPWVPPVPTALGLLAGCIGLLLIEFGRPREAQILTVVPLMIGGFSVLAFAYGDEASTIAASSLPGTATALPAAIAMLLSATAVLAATAADGVSAWIIADSPGRNAVRRLLPMVLAAPILLAGMARWTNLESHIGEARTWASVMWTMAIAICVVAAAAVGIVDRLASAAKRAEITDLQLVVAQRTEQVATLAQSLAGALTVEDVSDLVNAGATLPVGARAASVGIIDRRNNLLRVHHGPDVDPGVKEKYANPPLDAPLAFTEAARTGVPIFLEDRETYSARYPDTDPLQQRLGRGARASLPLRDQSGSTFGAVALSWDDSVDFDDTLRSTLSTIAELIARSLERARLSDAITEDLRRSRDVANLAEVLTGASTLPDVMGFLAEQVTATLGAVLALVGTIDDDRVTLRRSFPSTFPPELAQQFGVERIERPLPLSDAILTEKMVLITDRAEMADRYPHALDTYDAAPFVSTAHLPLRGRHGAVVGALGIAWAHAVNFDERLVALLRTIADLAAQTLDRVWLIDDLLREGRRSARIATLAEALVSTETEAEIAAIIIDSVPQVLGAHHALLALLDESGTALVVHGAPASPAPLVNGHTFYPLTEDRPETRAVRDHALVALSDADDARRRFPLFADELVAGGANGYAALPIVANDEIVLGVLGVAWTDPLAVDESSRAVLSTVTDLISQTLERVRLAEAEHELVEQLQRRILRSIPTLGCFEIASRYEPATARVGMGGDWFEGIRLDGGARLALVVGDVVGHGMDAAADMAHLRSVLSVLLRVGTPLEELFQAVDDALDTPTVMATAAVMVFDPDARVVSYVCAGHPPPLLVAPDTSITLLEDGRHPLIGGPTRTIVVGTADFEDGSLLVAYTDGLVEARRESIDLGIGRLVHAVGATSGMTLEARADELMRRCTDGQNVRDDIALVLVSGRESGRTSGGLVTPGAGNSDV